MKLTISDLKESNEFLNTLFDNITSAIFIVDKDFRVIGFNNSFLNLFKKKNKHSTGKRCGNALGCYFAELENKECCTTAHCEACLLRASLVKTFTERVPVINEKLIKEFIIDNKLVEKHFQFSTKFIQYQGEEMIIVIVDDISELETQKNRLKDLNEIKNKFLGMAAHDLRNPLTTVLGYSDLLLIEEKKLDKEQKDYITTINHTAQEMMNLLNDLLDISAIESGKFEIKKRELKLNDLISDRISKMSLAADKKSIKIISKLNDVPQIQGDPMRIAQVFDNLLSNAIKFSPKNSVINTELFQVNGYILLTVKDQGPGISDEDKKKLYGEFQRLSAVPTGGETSTGMGLSIVKKIVDACKAEICVKSKVGTGTEFEIKFPIRTR